ncbi:hypothetical protein J6590_087161, partial [Homalodisca vitripennis]
KREILNAYLFPGNEKFGYKNKLAQLRLGLEDRDRNIKRNGIPRSSNFLMYSNPSLSLAGWAYYHYTNAPETGSGTNRVRPNLGQNFLESD